MEKYQIRIELLSDLCVSDGGVYNSMLDTDICQDEYGFPYIPAKRLRGCLRECAQELMDWGDTINVAKMFGKEGNSAAAVRLGNAYPEGYEEKKGEAVRNMGNPVFHPQNVLNHYTYIRMQTAVNYETGTADDTSLRTMRVANKGLVFLAEAELSGGKETVEKLRDCCSLLTHMGIARTRGLGEVKATMEPAAKLDCAQWPDQKNSIEIKEPEWGQNTRYRLEYALYLKEPVICKSIDGGEAKTQDYIEGNKILGLLRQNMNRSNADFLAFINQGELFCSNAYPDIDGRRGVEVPATFYGIKNNDEDYINKAYETAEKAAEIEKKEEIQLNQMKHCYVWMNPENGELKKAGVRTEERYHHSRSEDKAIGRVDEKSDKSKLYQISSICAGQMFRGYLEGNSEQIKQIYDCLKNLSIAYIGYGKTSEYGKILIQITNIEECRHYTIKQCKDFVVKLESPAIIYNEKAFYSTNADDLIAEVLAEMGLSNLISDKTDNEIKVDKYLRYTISGGFNVTWGCRKPVIEIFDKGTVLEFHLTKPVDIDLPKGFYIGERILEGFGEVSVERVEMSQKHYCGKIISDTEKGEQVLILQENMQMGEELCKDLFINFLRARAIRQVEESFWELCGQGKPEDIRPVVSNMLLMCSECDTVEAVVEAVKERYNKLSEKKRQKKDYADKILSYTKIDPVQFGMLFEEQYAVCGFVKAGEKESPDKCTIAEPEKAEMQYLKSYLQALKYKIRSQGIKNVLKSEERRDS